MIPFSEFKLGPAHHVFAALGEDWATIFDTAESYEGLRYGVVKHNNPDVGRFVAAVRRYAKVCSSGEYKLLLALCTLCDFGHIADDLSGNTTWQNISRNCDKDYRAAIAACVQAAP